MNNDGTQAPEQLIINGQEYTLEDATRYIDLGRKYNELEGKLNTSLDKVYPEYTKATQRNKDLERELEETKAQLSDFAVKNQTPANPDKESAIKAARELGLADQDWLKEEGFVRKTDLDEYFNRKQTQQQQVENVLKQANKLEQDIDGSDGRVPFDQKAVLAYASAYNMSDLTEAYEEMNSKANASWKQKQIAKEERPGLTTLRGGTKRATPEQPKVTDDNFKQMWEEMFGGAEE